MKRLLPWLVLPLLAAAFVGLTLAAPGEWREERELTAAGRPIPAARDSLSSVSSLTDTVPITVTDSVFIPQSITVTMGSSVVWTNHGSQTHRLASLSPGYRIFLPLVLRNYTTSLAGEQRSSDFQSPVPVPAARIEPRNSTVVPKTGTATKMDTLSPTDILVKDLTVSQFRELLRDTVAKVMQEFLGDPDAGLALRPAIQEHLRRSLTYEAAGGKMIPLRGKNYDNNS